jgi:hypothetical protein
VKFLRRNRKIANKSFFINRKELFSPDIVSERITYHRRFASYNYSFCGVSLPRLTAMEIEFSIFDENDNGALTLLDPIIMDIDSLQVSVFNLFAVSLSPFSTAGRQLRQCHSHINIEMKKAKINMKL